MSTKLVPGHNAILTAFFKKVASVSAIRVTATALMLFNYLLFARLYPAADLGLYLIVLGITTTAGTLVSLGIPDGILPLISHHRIEHGFSGLARLILMASLIIVVTFVLVSLLVPAILYVADGAGWSLPAPRRMHIGISVAGIGAYALMFLFSQVLLALGQQRSALALFYCPSPVALMITLLLVWAVFPGAPVEILLLTLPFAWLGAATICAVTALAIVRREPVGSSQARWSDAVTRGLPMLGTRTVTNIDTWSPLWISGALLSVHDAGVFGGAIRLIGGLMAIPQAILFLSRATFAQLISHRDMIGLENYARLIATSLGGLLGITAVICWLTGDAIMAMVFGTDYAAAGLVLALFASGYALQFLTGGADKALMMGGRERFVLGVNVLFVPLTLTALAFGFDAGGMTGGAAGFMLVRTFKYALLLIAMRRIFGFWSVPTVDKHRLAAGAAIFAPAGTVAPADTTGSMRRGG